MTRLLIVDQASSMPSAYTRALTRQSDIEVVGIVSTVEEALAELANCDMIMVSATLPQGGALELIKAVVDLDPWIRVLVTHLAEAEEGSTEYIDAGAAGWVL